ILKAEDFGGQMLVFGESESNDLDFAGLSRGKKDIFILKINRNINKVFLKTIGGPGDDIFADALYLGADGMIVFSTVNTPGGQVDSLKGGRDIWMSRLDKDAKLLWSRLIGGRLDETAVKAILTPANEILLIGNSNSKDQDIKANYGGSDALVMKLDTAGNILWQQNYGGTSGDNSGAICLDAAGSIYFVGQSFSVNNDLPATNTVPPDFWTMKLFECHSTLSEFSRDACIGDTLTIGKQSYYSGKENGVDTFFNVTANGCDSIVQVQVHFHPATSGQILDTLCNDATMTINNVIFDKNNTTRTFSLTNHLGCDSTLQVDLSFLPEILVTDTLITKDDGTGSGCIKVTVEGGCEPYRYEWSNGAQTPEVCSLAKGTYTLTLKDCMDCSREFSFNVGTTVANEDLNAELPVISYAGDRIIVRTGSVNITRLSLYTVSGQLIRNQEPGIAELALLRSDLPNGSLLMDLVLENGRSFQFLVVN
ncbi:MAG TPA: SprB repeat-containing protein, partial [Saprospiraceae bacterium]|nr:SprB repeat-containing protein [Saprospiraceae bacterium]